jgi:thiamine transport system permease protein
MAKRIQPLGAAVWAGALSAGLVLALVLGSGAAVALRAELGAQLGPADWAAIRFTLLQATLSAGLSTILATARTA